VHGVLLGKLDGTLGVSAVWQHRAGKRSARFTTCMIRTTTYQSSYARHSVIEVFGLPCCCSEMLQKRREIHPGDNSHFALKELVVDGTIPSTRARFCGNRVTTLSSQRGWPPSFWTSLTLNSAPHTRFRTAHKERTEIKFKTEVKMVMNGALAIAILGARQIYQRNR